MGDHDLNVDSLIQRLLEGMCERDFVFQAIFYIF